MFSPKRPKAVQEEELKSLVPENGDDGSESSSEVSGRRSKARDPSWVDKRSWSGNFMVAARYVWKENFRNKRNFFVGLTAVFLVVFSIALLQNTVDASPGLFLKLAEDTVGELDMIMVPRKTLSSGFLINSTDVAMRLAKEPSVSGVSPRWLFLTRMINKKEPNRNSSTIVLFIDTKREKEIGIGRGWPNPPLVGRSCHVSAALLRQLGLKPNIGQPVRLQVDFLSLFLTASGLQTSEAAFVQDLVAKLVGESSGGPTGNDLFDSLPSFDPIVGRSILEALGVDVNAVLSGNFDVEAIKKQLSIGLDLTVEDAIEDSAGKFPKALGNVVIVERQLVTDLVNEFIANITSAAPENVNEAFKLLGINDPITRRIVISYLRVNFPTFFGNGTRPDPPKFNLDHYALTVVAMYANRFVDYLKDKNEIDAATLKWSNKIAEALGIDYPVSFQTTLIDTLALVYYLRLLLDQILLVVQVFLVGLGMFLIYALLLSDVESKVYESGMLRALGMEQYTLIMLLGIQSVLFSVPGVLLGLFATFLAFIPIGSALSGFTRIALPMLLTPAAVGMGVSVGFVMPLVSLISPVQRALSKTLRDALDVYHNSVNDVTVTITKLENLGISALQATISILMVVFGFVIYFLVPMSFIFLNLALFFNIFVTILLGMLLGLSLLAMMLHPISQRFSVELIMWGSDRRVLKGLVLKNLVGHASRNTKTAVLFTTCIAFIIFAGSVFTLQSKSLVDNVKTGVGTDILVASFSSSPDFALDETGMRNWLEEYKKSKGAEAGILAYSFAAFSINDLDELSWTTITNLAEYPAFGCLIYGVEENYLDATFDQYLVVQESDNSVTYSSTRSGRQDIVRSLFSTPGGKEIWQLEGIQIPPEIGTMKYIGNVDFRMVPRSNLVTYNESITMIFSEALRTTLSVNTKTPIQFTMRIIASKQNRYQEQTVSYHLGHPRAMVSKMPGFFFSSYSQTSQANSVVVVSMDSYYKLLQLAHENSYLRKERMPSTPPKRALFIRLIDNPSFEQRDAIVNGLRNFIKSDRIQVTDTAEIVHATDIAVLILNLFFNIVAVIVLVLCFFTLLVSFTSNVNENAWEFGVLRSLGLSGAQTIRVYIYEAMAIIMASVLLGFVVGSAVAITLTLQADLFSELPFQMHFPTLLFCSILGMSLVVSVFGSYIPANALRNKKIASALKGL